MGNYVKFKKICDEIDVLLEAKVTSDNPLFISWQTKAERFIRNHFGDGPEFSDFSNTYFCSLRLNTTYEEDVQACRDGLINTKAKFVVYLDEMEEEIQANSESKNAPTIIREKFLKVFIVHGHENALKQEVARILEKQGIEAVILSEQVNLGDTIIEKFEKNSDVTAAICLFTEDDLGSSNKEKILKYRARQNVVFEAGYFIGKLGRKNVILLASNEIEMPSDLAGVVYSSDRMWQIEVLQELKAIGFNIDMNKAF